jgi:hypothetical protein
MDAILMASGLNPTEEELLHNEIESLKASLASETERCAQLAAEVGRLHAALNQASIALNESSVMCSNVNQIKGERDLLKRKLDDHLKFRSAPLEAQVAEANRLLLEQRLQFRSIVDVLASQRDWVREWAVQCQENLRLQDLLAKREAGTEVEGLRRHLLETHARFVELTMTLKQCEATSVVFESKSRSLALENERLAGETALLKEQNKRLWKRVGEGRQPSNKKQSSGSDGH